MSTGPAKQRPSGVIGSINMDLVCRAERIPLPGETVLGSDPSFITGGKGANQAVAAARLGGRVHLVGRVGDDGAGIALQRALSEYKVDTRHVTITPGVPSGSAILVVDARGENSIVVAPGANARVTSADVDAAAPLLRSAAVVLLQLEIPLPTVRHAIRLCRRFGVPTILDPAPVPAKGLPRALYAVDVLTPNQPEAALLTRASRGRGAYTVRPQETGENLIRRGAASVVLKLGARGAAAFSRDGTSVSARPPRVRVVDSTAAGDAFTGALAVAMSEGMSTEQMLRFANAAGALCCTKLGAQPALPHRRDVERLLKRGRTR